MEREAAVTLMRRDGWNETTPRQKDFCQQKSMSDNLCQWRSAACSNPCRQQRTADLILHEQSCRSMFCRNRRDAACGTDSLPRRPFALNALKPRGQRAADRLMVQCSHCRSTTGHQTCQEGLRSAGFHSIGWRRGQGRIWAMIALSPAGQAGAVAHPACGNMDEAYEAVQ
jgi:hypothetical protein